LRFGQRRVIHSYRGNRAGKRVRSIYIRHSAGNAHQLSCINVQRAGGHGVADAVDIQTYINPVIGCRQMHPLAGRRSIGVEHIIPERQSTSPEIKVSSPAAAIGPLKQTVLPRCGRRIRPHQNRPRMGTRQVCRSRNIRLHPCSVGKGNRLAPCNSFYNGVGINHIIIRHVGNGKNASGGSGVGPADQLPFGQVGCVQMNQKRCRSPSD